MLKSISIKNFKGIKNLDNLRFGQGATFIIGQNGVGKSTLISAIYLTSQIIKHRSANEVLDEFVPLGEEFISHNSNSSTAEFSFCLSVREDIYRFSYSISTDSDLFKISTERLEELNPDYTIKELVYERMQDGIKVPNGNIPLHVNDDEFVLSSYGEDRTRTLASTIKNYKVLWFNGNNGESKFRVYSSENLNQQSLDAIAVKLYKEDPSSFESATKVIKTLIPSFTAPEIREISPDSNSSSESRYIVFWKEGWSDGSVLSYAVPGLSGGNLRIIELIFTLYSSKDAICLIGEELENGQYLGRIKTLLEIVNTLAIKRNIQMIFTTHSNDVLSNVSPRNVIYAEKNEDGYSIFQSLDEKVDSAYIKGILGEEPTTKDLIDMGVI
ncbi:AAA family ATPase [Candidatus Saccharibacteria bacterium]|nr:AAA family ATPase [Candidatus Saccharibacteria bacterium]